MNESVERTERPRQFQSLFVLLLHKTIASLIYLIVSAADDDCELFSYIILQIEIKTQC